MRSEIDYDASIEKASPALRLYIGKLEQENSRLRQEVLELRQLVTRRQRAESAREKGGGAAPVALATIRYPDDVMVISITSRGLAKRTPLNDYSTQRSGGVGVFDILSGRDDPVVQVLVARTGASLLILRPRGRAFRVPLDTVPLTEVRGRGGSLPERLMFTADEAIGCALALDQELDDRSKSTDCYDRRPGARSASHICRTSLAAAYVALRSQAGRATRCYDALQRRE